MHFHGTADATIPYAGGGFIATPPVRDSFAYWASVGQCTDSPEVSIPIGPTGCETHDACGAGIEVHLCTITNGDHILYGNGQIAIAATAWEFFERYPLP